MSFQLIIKEEAIQDMAEAFEWYEQQREGLGSEFLNEVEACMNKAVSNPQRFPTFEGFKVVLTNRFPYKIVFETEHDSIVVYAVYHDKRSPKGLSARM